MPTYQYLCNKCGHQFEEMQRISELPLTECPKCHGDVERVITGGAGILFKGSGFYITDYRKKDYKDDAGEGQERVILEGLRETLPSAESQGSNWVNLRTARVLTYK